MEEDERMTADGWMSPEPDAAPSASGQGAGALGFTGAAPTQTAEASGFATLPSGTFGTGPTLPMLPRTWEEDAGLER
jgi:PPE-repeat protein